MSQIELHKNSSETPRLPPGLHYLFLALVFSLFLMKPGLVIFGNRLLIADFVFLPAFGWWFVCIARGAAVFRWHRVYWIFLFYLTAMLISVPGSTNPGQSLVKLFGETYLIGLAVMTFNLVRTTERVVKLVCKDLQWRACHTVDARMHAVRQWVDLNG